MAVSAPGWRRRWDVRHGGSFGWQAGGTCDVTTIAQPHERSGASRARPARVVDTTHRAGPTARHRRRLRDHARRSTATIAACSSSGSRRRSFREAVGHDLDLAQANCSVSAAGVLRGIHFSDVPPGQAKYVTCVARRRARRRRRHPRRFADVRAVGQRAARRRRPPRDLPRRGPRPRLHVARGRLDGRLPVLDRLRAGPGARRRTRSTRRSASPGRRRRATGHRSNRSCRRRTSPRPRWPTPRPLACCRTLTATLDHVRGLA